MRLALFDLDHTLLSGDSDVLWCEMLMDAGVLDRTQFASLNQRMEADYRAGTVSTTTFTEFYVSTLAGKGRAFWQPWRERFLHEVIAPRIGPQARALVEQHRAAGDTMVMSTATNRFITELTATHLGIPHLVATEVEEVSGEFTGKAQGELNMREGKIVRLKHWLVTQGIAEEASQASFFVDATFYSDSRNDLPLLRAVGHPVAVNPDATLAEEAAQKKWPVLHWPSSSPH